jgi:uncharacterized membrane protein YeaQ/YmgE (transglycosylase-associated protein family)
MTGFFVSIVVYFIGLWLGGRLLQANNIELPRISRWVVLNTFAILVSIIAALPF